ncbi:MAG TPA: hypothetical protein VIZ43_30455 [Trebonia sp.]
MELCSDHEETVAVSFTDRLGDQIDDRVAEALDQQFAELMVQPGPWRAALVRDRRAGLAVVLATLLLGTTVTVLADGFSALALAWLGMAVINIAYFYRRS